MAQNSRAQSRSHHSPAISRRCLLQHAGAGLIPLGAAPWLVAAAPQTRPAIDPKALLPLNRYPHMVQEYFVRRVREAQEIGDRLRAGVKTREDAVRYVEEVRRKIADCFGPFPEKTPLEPKVTGVVERDTYRIEKVIFQSRPGFMVTANLYIPKGRQGPMPGVVGSCGHSANGKAAEAYQSFSQGLARLGYVVLIYDPLGQGERLQYPDEQFAKSRVGVGVQEHLLAGNQQFLVDEFIGAWRAWDGIRALDYLLTRPEVDPKHVGITGNSGGGTLTTWLCGVEQRWTMAAPACFVTTFLHNMENELPADTEQCPPRVLAQGLDHSDFLAAMAPKPVIILAQEKDFFDVRGAQEAYERLRKLYALLGAEQNIALHVGPQPHGYTIENREAMYRWFNRITGVSEAQKEPEITIEKDETLWCAPHGQVAELKSRSIVSYTRAKSQALAKQRQPLSGNELASAVAALLKMPKRPGAAPEFRILRNTGGRKHPRRFAATYAVQTEPGIQALVYMLTEEALQSRPPQGRPRAVLYVSHHSADAELREEPMVAQLLKDEPGEALFFACDVRGIGESRPDTCGKDTFLQPYGSDYFYAIHSVMLDQPYVGQRTHDVLRVIDFLAAQGIREVHLAGSGWGTLPATFAALLSPAVVQVTLKGAPASYAELAEAERYAWPLSSLVPGVLKSWDLPDCYRALAAAKKLRILE